MVNQMTDCLRRFVVNCCQSDKIFMDGNDENYLLEIAKALPDKRLSRYP